MTYREYLSDFAPDREDVASGVSLYGGGAFFTGMIACTLAAIDGNANALMAWAIIFFGTPALVAAACLVGSFIHWAIVERNEEY